MIFKEIEKLGWKTVIKLDKNKTGRYGIHLNIEQNLIIEEILVAKYKCNNLYTSKNNVSNKNKKVGGLKEV